MLLNIKRCWNCLELVLSSDSVGDGLDVYYFSVAFDLFLGLFTGTGLMPFHHNSSPARFASPL